jgi:hypothetical protein
MLPPALALRIRHASNLDHRSRLSCREVPNRTTEADFTPAVAARRFPTPKNSSRTSPHVRKVPIAAQNALTASGYPLASNQGRPVRGRNHPMITSCGVRRLRGRLCRWTTALAKASASRPDRRFSRASAIHSRITARRSFGLAIWIPFRAGDGTLPDRRIRVLRSYSGHLTARYAAFWIG